MDAAAFTALVQGVRRSLVRYAAGIVGRDRAEDAVQIALTAAWIHLDGGGQVRDLKPWLYRCVRNSAINILASGSARHEGLPLHDWMPAAHNTALEVEQRDELHRALVAITELPADQRAALTAAAGGHTPAVTAVDLGITGGAVRMLLHRARTSVRAAQSTDRRVP